MVRILRFIFAVFFIMMSVNVSAQEKVEEKRYSWEASMSWGLNSTGWEFNGGVIWMPLDFFGVGATVGLDSEIREIADWGRGDAPSFDDDYCMRFLFNSSLLFRSPCLFKIKSKEIGFRLFASPGITLSPPAAGAKNADWMYWKVSAGVTASVSRYTFTLGYGYSDFYLFDGKPYSHSNDYSDSDKNFTHSVFLGIGCKF